MAGAAPSRNWWTLAAVCGATFMLLVDVTIVQVALPRIHSELHASFTNLQWVLDAYALSLSSLLLTAGTIADRFGRMLVFAAGVGLFTLASILCGSAQNGLQLDLARAFQGVGGAAMFTTALALIGQDFSGRARGTAIAAWGSTVGGAVAVGPLLGGGLTEALGWRWIFFVNIPIGVAVLAVCLLRMTNVRDPEARGLDLPGLVTFSGFLFLLVFALLRGNDEGWSSALVLGPLVGAAALCAAFVVVERRAARPMFDLSLFHNRAFTGVSVTTFAIGAGMFAVFPYLTLYLQNLLGYSPLQGGLRLLPCTIPVFLIPLLSRRFAGNVPAGLVLGVGLALVAGGLSLMSQISVGSRWTALLPGLILAGVGIGLANPAIAQVALAVVEPNRAGMASGISNTFRIGGLATGVAALGAVFEHAVQSRLDPVVPGPAHSIAAAVIAGGPRAATGNVALARSAFVTGMHDLLVVGAVVCACGAVSAFALIRARHLMPQHGPVVSVDAG